MECERQSFAGRRCLAVLLRRLAVGWFVIVLAATSCSSIKAPPTTLPEASSATSADPVSATTPDSAIPAENSAASASAPATETSAAAGAPVTTNTAAPLHTAQFTGLAVPAELTRPAAVVKIDNHPRALPQWGINRADVVYEELVEARLTRFAAIFHSQNADIVGPVRSARTGDFALLSNLNRPIFVNSGANAHTSRALRSVDAINITDGSTLARGVFERSSAKSAPHNLVTDTARIYAAGAGGGLSPPNYLRFRDVGEAVPGGQSVSGVDIDFGQIEASYRWDPVLGGWARTQNGRDHTDFDGVRIAPENVIVQFVRYGQSPANRATPEPKLTGNGEAWIFTNGLIVQGSWERLSERDLTVFRSSNGSVVGLTPGRTWIALARANSATLVQ